MSSLCYHQLMLIGSENSDNNTISSLLNGANITDLIRRYPLQLPLLPTLSVLVMAYSHNSMTVQFTTNQPPSIVSYLLWYQQHPLWQLQVHYLDEFGQYAGIMQSTKNQTLCCQAITLPQPIKQVFELDWP